MYTAAPDTCERARPRRPRGNLAVVWGPFCKIIYSEELIGDPYGFVWREAKKLATTVAIESICRSVNLDYGNESLYLFLFCCRHFGYDD